MNSSTSTTGEPSALPARLRLAREQAGLTQGDAAAHIGASRTTMVAIENGSRRVRDEELVALAVLYDRSVHELLRSTLPPQDLAVQLRSSLAADRSADSGTQSTVDQLERLCDDYLELEEALGAPLPMSYPAEYPIGNLLPQDAGQDAALAERNRLGLGDGPVPDLRALLEVDLGLRVFSIAMPSSVAGMFGCTARTGGVIAFNANHTYERQRWSMAHEFGHFLNSRHGAEITSTGVDERRSPAEKFAEAFAKHFLMPESGLRQRALHIRQSSPAGITAGDIVRLADRFQTSVQAMALRLQELKLIDAGFWTLLEAEGFRPDAARVALDLGVRERDTMLLPWRFQQIGTMAWEKGVISEGEFAKLLRTDRLEARRIAQLFTTASRSGAVGAGE